MEIRTKKMAEKLIALRGEKTQCEVAKALKISCSAISMYENGERVPRDEVKRRFAEYYNTSVQDIFFS